MKRKLLFTVVILLTALSGINAQVNLQNGLVAHYPLDGNANDASVHGYNGAVTGATAATDRYGRAGRALHFSGGSKIVANIATIPVDSATRTLALWAKWSGTAFINSANIANWGSSDSGRLFGIGVYKNNQWFALGFNYVAGFDLTSGVVADSTQWHHIVHIYEAGTMKIYIDGVLKASQPKKLNTTFSHLFIGNRPDEPSDSYYTGDVDEVMIYNRALTQDEINALYDVNLAVKNTKNNSLNCTVYPNPAKEVLQVKNAKAGAIIRITDMTGKLLKTIRLTRGDEQIDISALHAGGQYLLTISYEGKTQTEQFLTL